MKKLTEHKALYVAAGAGDLAVETLRTLPQRLARLQDKADLTVLSGRAVEYLWEAAARAVRAYDELAERGSDLVNGVDRMTPQQAAAQLEHAARSTAQETVRRANRTADAARKTAQTTVRTASQAATQAAGQAAIQAGQMASQASQVAGRASQVTGRASESASKAGESAANGTGPTSNTKRDASHTTRSSSGANRPARKHTA